MPNQSADIILKLSMYELIMVLSRMITQDVIDNEAAAKITEEARKFARV